MTKKVRSKNSKRRAQESILKTRRFIRISHHKHTGKHIPLHYTSYAILFFLIMLAAFTLFFARNKIVHGGPPQTQSGSVQLNGVVPGPPPSTPANITEPIDGQHFTDPIITMKGTCQANLIIEIYRNDAFAGSVICSNTGSFDISVTLIANENKLKAKTRDSINQYGPDSLVVTVYYDVPSEEAISAIDDAPIATAAQRRRAILTDPLLLYTKPLHGGVSAGNPIFLPYEISGGKSPYAVSIDWGDGSNQTVVSNEEAGDFSEEHTYTEGGQYAAIISASDQLNNKALVETVVIVISSSISTGQVTSTNEPQCEYNPTLPGCSIQHRIVQNIDAVWPGIMLTGLMTISFWLGERVVLVRLLHKPKHT